jgi:hypothetical protein
VLRSSFHATQATTIYDAVKLEHDPEKWKPVFGKDHAPTKGMERDDDSKKRRHAPNHVMIELIIDKIHDPKFLAMFFAAIAAAATVLNLGDAAARRRQPRQAHAQRGD